MTFIFNFIEKIYSPKSMRFHVNQAFLNIKKLLCYKTSTTKIFLKDEQQKLDYKIF